MNQSQQLNHLLRKRNKNINESLQKYEKGRQKCKTVSDFKMNQSLKDTNYFTYNSIASVKTACHLKEIGKIKTKQISFTRTMPEQIKPKSQQIINAGKDNKQTNVEQPKFNKQIQVQTQQQCKVKDKNNQAQFKLKSITKVYDIAIQSNSKHNSYTFAKEPEEKQTKLQMQKLNMSGNVIQKLINFDTQISKELQTAEIEVSLAPKITQSNLNKQTQMKHSLLTTQQIARKKIKARIKVSCLDLPVPKDKAKNSEQTLQIQFLYEKVQRMQLKNKILASHDIYNNMKLLRP